MKLRIVCLLLTIFSAVCVSQELEELVRAIADGKYNDQLAKLWKNMEDKAFEHRTKSNRQYQYLIAAHIYQNSDHKLEYIEEDIKYYTNIDVQQAKKDCDGYCKNKLNEIRTKIESTDTLDKLNRSIKGRNTAVHTELQFLYGKDFREAMRQGGIFLIYSYYIPCAGLAGSSFGECAGDLAYGLVDLRSRTGKPLYFVIMYSEVFKNRGETNKCVSKLYHINAGIPLLRCYQSGATRTCEVTVGTDQFHHSGESIRRPVFHRFPRINKAAESNHNQSDVFIRCLAMGEFIQKLAKQDTDYRMKLPTSQLYSDDRNNSEKIASWVKDQCSGNMYNISDVRQLIRPLAEADPVIFDVVKRCESYIGCLRGLVSSISKCKQMTDGDEALKQHFENLSTNDKSSGAPKDEF